MPTYGYIRTSRDQECDQHLGQTGVSRRTSDTCPLRIRDSNRYPETLPSEAYGHSRPVVQDLRPRRRRYRGPRPHPRSSDCSGSMG